MERLKISVLFWEERGPEGNRHDEVVEQVAQALTVGGHRVSQIAVNDDLRELLDKLDDKRPDLVFNLCERFADNDDFESHVAAVLTMLGQPFTGSSPAGLNLRQDKAITKKLLKFHDLAYPNFATFEKENLEFAGKMHFPFFVKPLHGDASTGIDDSSLVTEYSRMVERIDFIQKQLKVPALVEEYIDGREFYVSVLGNDPMEVLPLMELDFSKLPASFPRIYGHEAKSVEESPQYRAVNAVVATDLPAEVRARITAAGREAGYALKIQDYGRVDIRLSATGIPMVVEVNANPYLERTSAYALAALQAGMGYSTLINRIVEVAWKRLEPSPFLKELQKGRAERARLRRQASKIPPPCDIPAPKDFPSPKEAVPGRPEQVPKQEKPQAEPDPGPKIV